MQGESPKALSSTFENIKFPAINDKIKQSIADQEEALAAHELAQTRIAEQKKNTFVPFKKGQKVWLDMCNLKTNYHKRWCQNKKDCSKSRKYQGLSPIGSKYLIPGGFIMCFMLSCWNHTKRTRYMEKISLCHHQTSWTEKKFIKSKQFWNIGNEDKDINISSNEKDIWSLRPHRLTHFFQQQSTDEDWMLNHWYAHQQVIPGSDHTPPDSSTDSSQSQPLPIPPWSSHTPPIHIQTSPTVTESRWCQWRWEFLEEEFHEEPLEGTCENPIIIKCCNLHSSTYSGNSGQILVRFWSDSRIPCGFQLDSGWLPEFHVDSGWILVGFWNSGWILGEFQVNSWTLLTSPSPFSQCFISIKS